MIRHLLAVSFVLTLCIGLSEQVAAGQQLQKIREARQINIGFDGDPPFVYMDANRNRTGFEVELAQAIAQEIGVKAVLKVSKQDNLVASLTHGLFGLKRGNRIDLIIGGWTNTDIYKENFDFSIPYIISGMQLLIMKKNAGMFNTANDLIGKKIGIYQDSRWLKTNVPQAIVKIFDDQAAQYDALSKGLIDAVVENRFDAVQMVNAYSLSKDKLSDRIRFFMTLDPRPELALTGQLVSSQEVRIALRKGEPELKASVNQAIEKLRANGTLGEMSEKYFNADLTR